MGMTSLITYDHDLMFLGYQEDLGPEPIVGVIRVGRMTPRIMGYIQLK